MNLKPVTRSDLLTAALLALAYFALLAATCDDEAAVNQVYNVAVGGQTTLTELHAMLADALCRARPGLTVAPPTHRDFRAGDVRHSRADIGKAARLLGYAPSHPIGAGLEASARWYAARSPQGR